MNDAMQHDGEYCTMICTGTDRYMPTDQGHSSFYQGQPQTCVVGGSIVMKRLKHIKNTFVVSWVNAEAIVTYREDETGALDHAVNANSCM